MKPLYPPNPPTNRKTLRLGEHICDLYEWQAPDGHVILVHLLLPCPNCSYPISLSASDFNVDSQTLTHKIICPGRWKVTTKENFEGKELILSELDDKGKPIIKRCGFQGLIQEGMLKNVSK